MKKLGAKVVGFIDYKSEWLAILVVAIAAVTVAILKHP